MQLHQALAELARDHGHGLFRDAGAFRGSLDDYLDEGQASSGTINLLTDAVRLGALDGMITILDSGANPADAVESAGQRLARDRGSADVRGCQWALAVLGFALGRVPEDLVRGLDPDAVTATPPHHGPGGTAPVNRPVQSPAQHPQQQAPSPQHQPVQSPGHQPVPSGQPAHLAGQGYGAPQPSYGGWSQQPAKKRNTGLLVSVVAAAVVLLVAGVLAVVLLANSGGDDDPQADDPKSETTTSEVPDLGGPQVEGQGYELQLPDGWTDSTEAWREDNPSTPSIDKVLIWGDTFNTARGNVITEVASSFGKTDPNDLKDQWKTNLTAGDPDAETTDIESIDIDGKTALGVEIVRDVGGSQLVQRAYLTVSGDKQYGVVVTRQESDTEVQEMFEKMLTTWQWADDE